MRYWGIDSLLVFKPVRILIFILIFNAIGAAGILFEGGHAYPVVQTVGGSFFFGLGGAFMAFCGFAPILSKRMRDNWCNPDADFEKAKAGLIFLGVIGSFFVVMGAFMAVTKLLVHSQFIKSRFLLPE
jgi:hypothetical protein